MSLERLSTLHAALLALREPPEVPGCGLPLHAPVALELFSSQLLARHLDRVAHELRERGAGYYTITSAGHEGNVVLGRLLRHTDPALLHYRSAAFFVERARGTEVDAIDQITLSLCAAAKEPIAGGRHKVFGSGPLCVPPQTSTIGSHLPKAVGLALALERAPRLGVPAVMAGIELPRDAIVMCSFGDASINHASSTTALNAARWAAHQGLPLPLLFVCEDNGLGISVKTPPGWVEAIAGSGPALRYFAADGCDLGEAYAVTQQAIATCREQRVPVFLHLRTTRLLGHSGADPDATYRSQDELAAAAARDPLLLSAQLLMRAGVLNHDALRALDAKCALRVDTAARRAARAPKLVTAQQVMAPLAPRSLPAIEREALRQDFEAQRSAAYGGEERLPERQAPQPLSRLLNWALHELLSKYPTTTLFGEDVASKGGVYNITAGLWRRFGAGRVFNTLLDETMILGLAQGMALAGLLPVPEIQYLAFLHNAEDQLRGEAGSTQFFSQGQYRTPMLLRIAGLGYQKGFGGHFHNDNSLAVLRDIPGLIVAVPSSGRDAVRMLRTCAAAAHVDGAVVAFVEPIALYNQRDLHEPGDGGLAGVYPAPGSAIGLGEIGIYGAAKPTLTIVSYGNGVPMALRVAKVLENTRKARVAVLDLRWLSPLPTEAVLTQARKSGRLLVLDECRRPGNVGEAIAAACACSDKPPAVALVTAKDSYVPLAEAAEVVLVSEPEVLAAANALLDR